MRVERVKFNGRQDRYKYLVSQYRDLLRGRILDVGCDRAYLKTMVQDGAEYFGIDIEGTPDLRIDLEKIDRLPFDDDQFDCVVAAEVLEHLDSLHRVFCELVRVSRAHILISLPNCWRTLRSRLPRGYGTPHYYGLPAERPQDRHKWFFNVSDVVAFMEEQTRRLPVQVVEFVALEKVRPFPLRFLRRILYPKQERYLNRYAHSIWTLLQKRGR